jgi:hypothetical protein
VGPENESRIGGSCRAVWLCGRARSQAQQKKPNVVYFPVDNLGMDELSVYSRGPLRGTYTLHIDWPRLQNRNRRSPQSRHRLIHF